MQFENAKNSLEMQKVFEAFPDSKLWVCPGQWSFPFQLPFDWLGIPSKRTNILLADGFPHSDYLDWIPDNWYSFIEKLINELIVNIVMIGLKFDEEKPEMDSSSDIKKGVLLILDNLELLIKISLFKLFLSVSILIGNLSIISLFPLPIKLL